MMTPVSGTMTLLPKSKLMVVVRETASPELSAVPTYEVPGLIYERMQSKWKRTNVSNDSIPSGS